MTVSSTQPSEGRVYQQIDWSNGGDGIVVRDAVKTVSDLRGVYEAVWGVWLDPRNFHRKVSRTEGLLVPTGRTTTREGGRPAQLFRRGTLEVLSPPLVRPRD